MVTRIKHTINKLFVYINTTQHNTTQQRWALRDEPKNGCEGDYLASAKKKKLIPSLLTT